jgi:hypothetical protein
MQIDLSEYFLEQDSPISDNFEPGSNSMLSITASAKHEIPKLRSAGGKRILDIKQFAKQLSPNCVNRDPASNVNVPTCANSKHDFPRT